MPLVVVMEDEAVTRTLVAAVLRQEGYEVMSTENGRSGLELVRLHRPDLVISDIQMPVMDGFAMLQALRADPAILATPVILLTLLHERAHMRIGMTSGADDYIAKPFRPWELCEAAAAQLNRRKMQEAVQALAVEFAMQSALEDQKQHLARLYERRLARELSNQWPAAAASGQDEQLSSVTMLFVDVVNYAELAEKLTSAELSEVVHQFYNNAGDTVHLFGARHMQFVGDGLMVVFADDMDTASVNHALRAARAALGLIDAARRVQQFLIAHFPHHGLPRFEVSVALNSGPVALASLGNPLHGGAQILPIGDTVSVTLLLQKQAHKAGWQIAVSASTLPYVTGLVATRGLTLISLPGRMTVTYAAELVSLVFGEGGFPQFPGHIQ